MIAAIFSLGFALQTLRIAIPYVLAALGGTLTERAGVVDLALEAKLLFGALAAAIASHATGSIAAGVVAGALGGATVAALQAACVVAIRAEQVIIGVALNVLAIGGTRYLLQLLYGQGANSPLGPSTGSGLLGNPSFYIAVIAAISLPLWLARSVIGLRIRAAGDRPLALAAAGVSITRVRLFAMLFGGALAGIGGAQLSLSVGAFSADMASGRGYLALAAVILAGWRPGRAAMIALAIAAAEALNVRLQLLDVGIPHQLAPLLPYVLTLVILIAFGAKRQRAPAALNRGDDAI